MMRIGLFGDDAAGRPLDKVIERARATEEQGFASFWLPQVLGPDAITLLAVVGREVPRIELGTAVVPTYPRHPSVMAQQALTAQAASGNRFALGIGLSHKPAIEGMYAIPFDRPVRHLREYLTILMGLLHDGSVSYAGETLTYHGRADVAEASPPPVLVAALGPQMLRLTGALADGTLTWMTGPATLEALTIPTITAAAAAAGRPAPRVGVSLPICLTDDPAAVRERAARDFVVYGTLPSYRAMLDREGAAGPADVALVGDEAELTRGLDRLRDLGVTDFVASTFGGREARVRTTEWLQSRL